MTKDIVKRCRSAVVIQIILIHIHSTFPANPLPRRVFQDNSNNKWEIMEQRGAEYQHPLQQRDDNQEIFLRNEKSGNQARLLQIDLSGLRQASLPARSISRHKPPMNLLGIDISVLSHNPDPTMPIARAPNGNKKIMLLDPIDTRYDRLPVIKSEVVRNHPILSYTERKDAAVSPFIHLPFKVVTSYHSISTDKKHSNLKMKSDNLKKIENEQLYTANFILRLLYQLSNNYHKEHSI